MGGITFLSLTVSKVSARTRCFSSCRRPRFDPIRIARPQENVCSVDNCRSPSCRAATRNRLRASASARDQRQLISSPNRKPVRAAHRGPPAVQPAPGADCAQPEDFPFDVEFVTALARLPRVLDGSATACKAPLGQQRLLDVGEVGQMQTDLPLRQLGEQQFDARLPLQAQVDASRLEGRIGEVQADDAVMDAPELEAQRLARVARSTQPTCGWSSDSRSAASARRAEGEVVPRPSSGVITQVIREAPVLVGDPGQAPRGYHPHARQALLARILVAIAVGVVEHLADHVRAIEGRIRHHAHTVAVATPDIGLPPTPAKAWARFTNSPSPTPAPTASSSTNAVVPPPPKLRFAPGELKPVYWPAPPVMLSIRAEPLT